MELYMISVEFPLLLAANCFMSSSWGVFSRLRAVKSSSAETIASKQSHFEAQMPPS